MNKPLLEKSNLTLRLSGYAASAGALLAIGSVAKGQVVYSGLQNLEVNMPNEYMEIDLDGDMVNDFGFSMYGSVSGTTFASGYSYSYWGYGAIINPKTDSYSNSWIVKSTLISSYYGSNTKSLVNGLDAGINVNSTQSMWSNLSYPMWPGVLGVGSFNIVFNTYYSTYNTYTNLYGDFVGEEKYIGVRFYIGTEQHYGWIRASIGAHLEPMTIVDWAYEETPGVGILTGDIGLPDIEFSGVDDAVSDAMQTLTISFSEEVTGFEISDIVVTNGVAANLVEVTAGLEYSVEVTADAEGEVQVEIGADAVTDGAGLSNESATVSWMYDGTPPTVTLNSGVSGTTNNQTVTVSVEFSEEIEGLELGDFAVTNGTAANLAEVTAGTEFAVDITAVADGEVTVSLPEGAVTDAAGNDNTAASTAYTYEEPVNGLNGLSEEGIKIYPNPADDNLHIELENESMVSIINMNGTVLYQNDQVFNETISLTGFAPGMYIVRVKNGDRVTQHRLVIE